MQTSPSAFDGLPVEHRSPAFVLVDASAVLPQRTDRRYGTRDPQKVDKVIVHQSQGGTKEGRHGLLHTARFFIGDDDPATRELEGRGWPGFAYTFWVPYRPELDVASGAPIVYRCQPDNAWSYHTRPHNEHGVAIAFQGWFRSRGAPHKGEPSRDQQKVLRPLCRYVLDRFKLDAFDLYTHSDFGKADCPGYDLEREVGWMRRTEFGPLLESDRAQQEALCEAGFIRSSDITGEPNDRVRLAIERLQGQHDFPVTGMWTRPIDTLIRRLLPPTKERA